MVFNAKNLFNRLERRILLVAVASLLPIAILACGALFLSALDQKQRLLRAHEQTMLALITAVDSELRSSMSALKAFAARPRLAAGDFAALHAEARLLLTQQPAWTNVVISTPEAEQVMNAALPLGGVLPRRLAPRSIEIAASTGRPHVGEVAWSPVLRAYGVAVLVPFLENGKTRYVLTAVVKPESFLPVLQQQRLPVDGVIGVMDGNGRFVTRSRDAQHWVGREPAPGLARLLKSGGSFGWSKTTSLEGIPVYSIFHRSAFSGWSAAMGVPRAIVDAPLRRAYLIMAAAILISVLLGLSAALFVGRTIVRPIRQLQETAARLGHGEAPVLPTTDLPEIAAVGVALAASHAEREDLFAREREARIAAENASKQKDEFVAMLGHELRNPLAAITNASFLLSREARHLSPVAVNASNIVQRQAKHLARLTDDLLDAGRVILGKIVLSRAPLELAEFTGSVVESFRSTGRLADHAVELALEPVWIDADATRLEQIITNILSNATRYTPAGGRLYVSVRALGDQALLEVRDSGSGIAPELLPRVFDLFVQGERPIDRRQGGLGIGLTLVKRLAELHGGTASASSAGVGQGSSFTVTFPAIAPAAEQTTPRAAEPRRTLRIALVEDNDDTRASLGMLLKADGHVVVEAADGAAGLDVILGTETWSSPWTSPRSRCCWRNSYPCRVRPPRDQSGWTPVRADRRNNRCIPRRPCT